MNKNNQFDSLAIFFSYSKVNLQFYKNWRKLYSIEKNWQSGKTIVHSGGGLPSLTLHIWFYFCHDNTKNHHYTLIT